MHTVCLRFFIQAPSFIGNASEDGLDKQNCLCYHTYKSKICHIICIIKERTHTMPYIEVKTNIKLSGDTQAVLKSQIADVLAASFPGKTENWLMLSFVPECSMYFGGSDAPCMFLDTAIFGSQTNAAYDAMTAGICDLIEKECGIPKNRIYIKYEEVSHWGWNSMNF